ncbi:unnamed protein product [Ectocarpus sp. CCAP 1310/34]|nr:unnamed protein product [Ectocarpus sp. CCAP 1310/34]
MCFFLVTRGSLWAPRGIGKAIVEELACLGAKVLTCSRTEDGVTACITGCLCVVLRDLSSRAFAVVLCLWLQQEWRAKGLEVYGIAVDVTTAEGRQELYSAAEERFDGALDILVNNVGRSIRKSSTFDYTPEEFETIIDTNFSTVLSLTKARLYVFTLICLGRFASLIPCSVFLFHPLLKAAAAAEGARAKGGSSVVNISSIAGVIAVKTGAAYAASKAAINRLTINWGCEWAKDGIRVNAVAPGATNTPSTESVPRSTELMDRIPMGRWAEPHEISGQVAFLCMKGASYITSQVICVDGGWASNGWM